MCDPRKQENRAEGVKGGKTESNSRHVKELATTTGE